MKRKNIKSERNLGINDNQLSYKCKKCKKKMVKTCKRVNQKVNQKVYFNFTMLILINLFRC